MGIQIPPGAQDSLKFRVRVGHLFGFPRLLRLCALRRAGILPDAQAGNQAGEAPGGIVDRRLTIVDCRLYCFCTRRPGNSSGPTRVADVGVLLPLVKDALFLEDL